MDLRILRTKTDTTVSMRETKFKDGEIVTNGGRVLGITAKGETLKRSQKECICCYRVDQLCKQVYASRYRKSYRRGLSWSFFTGTA